MGTFYQPEVADRDLSHCLKELSVDPDHLFRHLTEVNGKDTRGGYIEGQLEFQDDLLVSSFGLKICLVSDRRCGTSKRVHPNLLYMTRFDGKSRQRELEARAPMWRIDLEIKGGDVFWWTESEAQALYKQHVCSLRVNQESGRRSILDIRDLHLTVITPLVRTNVNGIRVKDGLAMRKPLFDDEIMEDEWEEVLKKLDKFFTGKEGKSEMDRICLQFDFHRFDLQGNEELKPMCEPIISNTIINSKSRNLGILELYPDTISAQKACCKYGRTIYLPSKFKLPTSEKDAYPRFVVQFHNDDPILDDRIRQPEDIKIFASQIFVFKTPVQDEAAIRQIYVAGGKIFIEAFRPKDKQSSSVKFEFEFKVHNNLNSNSIEWCSFCLENPDKIGQTMEESLKQRLSSSGVAKPGQKRRKKDTMSSEGRNTMGSPDGSLLSPSSVLVESPSSLVSEDQQQLMEDINDFIATGNDLNDFDIDVLLQQEIPDVLQGVMHVEGLPMSVESELESEVPPNLGFPVAQSYSSRSQLSPSPDHLSFARCLSPSSPPGAGAPSFSTLVKTDISASYESDLCCIDNVETASALSWNLEKEEVPTRGQEVSDAKQMQRRSLKLLGSDKGSEKNLGNHLEILEYQSKAPTGPSTIISRINNLSQTTKISNEKCGLKNSKREKCEQPNRSICLMSKIDNLSSDFPKSEDNSEKTEPETKISTLSLISRLNKVTKIESSTDSIHDVDSAYRSQESLLSNSLDSLGPSSMTRLVKKNEIETSDTSDNERELKVLEITKKFGGAKRKCMEKLKSKMSKSESKNKLEIRQDLADCFPALIYIITPVIVMFMAVILNFFWIKYFSLENEDSVVESLNSEIEKLVPEE